jgi:hypothetical protein
MVLVKGYRHAILGEKGEFVSDDHFFSPARALSTVLSSKTLKF